MAKLLGVERNGTRTDKTYVEDGNIHIVSTEDAEKVIDANKRQYNDANPFDRSDFRKVASFPKTIIEETARLHGIPFNEFIQSKTDRAIKAWNQLLNGRDTRYFRTAPGRVDIAAHKK